VKDAAADADAIAEMILLHMDEIEQIIITLDTHNVSILCVVLSSSSSVEPFDNS
jgi:hypothetical protein